MARQISSWVAIELLRTGAAEGSVLKDDTRYVALFGTNPQVEFNVPLSQRKFGDLVEQLRYTTNSATAVRLAREALEEVVRSIFSRVSFVQDRASDVMWLHLRLVVAPKELGLLPYEFSLTPPNLPGAGERPFLVNPLRLTTLTREIRQNSPREFKWPAVPRVLFAWAEPGDVVPHQAHADKLMSALRPWVAPLKGNAEPVPDLASRFTELSNATVSTLHDAIVKAGDDPYTHVHILAHGTKVEDRDGERFALALHSEGAPANVAAVDGWTLANALTSVEGERTSVPAIVVVSACDGGNEGGPLVPGASLAHALHTSGIPYVLASQFPLTVDGSIDMANELYPRLFKGDDPRAVLYYVRARLLRNPNTHDWGSLVAYARFPDDLDQQLEWVRLKLLFTRLKTANAWVDHVLKFHKNSGATFADVENRIDTAIVDLEKVLNTGMAADNPKIVNENRGLLGNGYKRKAEHLYRRAALKPETANADRDASRRALSKACSWYLKGHDALLSDHWVGCQYLSLTAVLKGTLVSERDRWTVVHFAATKALDQSEGRDRLWPLGTLAELHLLQPLTVTPDRFESAWAAALATARDYATKFEHTATDGGFNDEIESLARQIDRYVSWWPAAFPSPVADRLKAGASELQALLPSVDEL